MLIHKTDRICIYMRILFGCKKEICICIKIRSVVITHFFVIGPNNEIPHLDMILSQSS
jgi:hypothetical protein